MPPDSAAPSEVFRIKLSVGTENGGGGEWPMYTDREVFETALLQAALEVEARQDGYRNQRTQRTLAWVLRRQPKSTDKDGSLRRYGIRRVFVAEQFLDGAWVPLTWEVTPPQITVTRP